MKEAKKVFLMMGAVALFISVLGIYSQKPEQSDEVISRVENLVGNKNAEEAETITLDGTELTVLVADSNSSRSKGLSGVEHLDDNEGMLFNFDKPTEPVFWMKDMLIDIDIIWIKDGKIVGIEKSVQPPVDGTKDEDLERYSAGTTVDQVLEVRGGLSDEKGFEVGDSVDLSSV